MTDAPTPPESDRDPRDRDPRDRDLVYRDHFDKMTRIHLRRLIDSRLIEEHRRNPAGRPSEALGRVLAYFRRLPASRQYLIRELPGGKYRIIAMAPARRGRPIDADEVVFDTLEAAYHGVFLKKLNDLLELDNG
jgi:branched-chain amino acid transport system permease protein